jgi:hypothetical protein
LLALFIILVNGALFDYEHLEMIGVWALNGCLSIRIMRVIIVRDLIELVCGNILYPLIGFLGLFLFS